MLEHLTSITLVALWIKTLRAKKICKLFEKNGVEIDRINNLKTISLGNNQNHVSSKTTNGDQINAYSKPE
ncbi:12106_t:CDS:2, partial [Funneliformis geosporum]